MTGSAAGRWALDGALAAAAAYAAALLTTELAAGLPASARNAALLLAVVYGGALLFRRVAPLTVLAVQGGAAIAYTAVGLPVAMLGPAVFVTLYTTGALRRRRTSLTALAAAEVLLAVLLLARPGFPGAGSWVLYSLLLAAAWFLGDIVRRWRSAAAVHARRAVELEQAREELARLAVAEERLRIARELHDVVAHTMTVIAMHAGSGRLAVDRDPAAARRALEVVEESSRHALAELRRLVTVLRDADGPAPGHEPAPGLPDLHRLVAEVAAAGIAVDVHTEGDLARVPEGVSLAAYRIVQEALTNVVRHAGTGRARLSVAVREDRVRLEVDDEGGGHAGPAPAAGHGYGVIGMRERAALYGGELTAGPGPGGRWRVAGWLPYAAVRS